MFGESVVMRVLDRSVVSLDLTKVGMDDETIGGFREVIEKPNGIVLVTGPTGSGKTTTLYSALSELNDIKEKLITTEDPVEYDTTGSFKFQLNLISGSRLRPVCGPSCVKIRTKFLSGKFGISKRRRSQFKLRSRATSSSVLCIPTTLPAR